MYFMHPVSQSKKHRIPSGAGDQMVDFEPAAAAAAAAADLPPLSPDDLRLSEEVAPETERWSAPETDLMFSGTAMNLRLPS